MLALQGDNSRRQHTRSVAVWRAIEALHFKVAYKSAIVNIALVFELSEIVAVHNDELPACATCGHYVVATAVLSMSFVCLSHSLVEAERGFDFLEDVHFFVDIVV